MQKKFVVAVVMATALAGAPAIAQSTKDHLLAQLRAQGFTNIEVSRTWLGRTRIEGVSGAHEREIIFNTRTGEILRDYWKPLDEDDETPQQLINPAANTDSTNEDSEADGSGNGTGGSGVGSQAALSDDIFDYLNGGQSSDTSLA